MSTQPQSTDPMTDAELRVARERLGLTADALAGLLGVQSRSVRRWETGEREVPDAVHERMREMERVTAAALGHALEELRARGDAQVTTFRADEDLWATRPDDRPMPASWHRAVVGRLAAEIPGVRIRYAPTASSLIDAQQAWQILSHQYGIEPRDVPAFLAGHGVDVYLTGRQHEGYPREQVEALLRLPTG